ncbi:RNA polymerase-binding transcription factor DksA [Arthrobacter subterraneus]|uniref:RNA polymerase-binding transcription factor DksA n=1 Tax=Arthrobacter subterraneus TaxID=335973 RepID=A0A1G8CVD1_9MICC|nr:TraR/DksA C4-type zinc finger protein [Arthrobacter subterraneus]SDH49442.1 RNA polymerase-binding transcription factor DksA [Arthrobacter subterraneus]
MGVSEHFRPLLVRELTETRKARAGLSTDITSTSDLRRESNVDDEHDPEGSTIAFELSQSATLLRDADARIAELEAALLRLEEGRYGSCEVCGTAIAEGRLEARPWTRFCINHAGGR